MGSVIHPEQSHEVGVREDSAFWPWVTEWSHRWAFLGYERDKERPEQLEGQRECEWKEQLQGGLGDWSFILNTGSLTLNVQEEMSRRQVFNGRNVKWFLKYY